MRWIWTILAGGLLALAAHAAGPEVSQIARTLQSARAALEDGFCDLAQRQLDPLLDRSERRSLKPAEADDALLLLGRALHGQGKYDEILARLDPTKDLWVRDVEGRAPLAFWRAMARYARNEPEYALTELRDFAARYEDETYRRRALRLQGLCLVRAGRVDEGVQAFAEFDKIYRRSPDAAANLLDWGKTLSGTGRLDEARSVLARLDESARDSEVTREGRYWLGQAYLRQGLCSNAVEVLARVGADTNAVDDLRARAWVAVGAAQAECLSNRVAAAEALGLALAQARDPVLRRDATFRLGRALVNAGRLDEGVKLLKAEIAAAPDDPRAEASQLHLASALLQQGRHAEAADEYLHYLETYQKGAGKAEAYEGRGWGLLKVGRFTESAAAFQSAMDLHTDPARKERCLFKMGDACFANGQYRLALDTYRRLLREFPGSALAGEALFQVAACQQSLGEGKEAEKSYAQLADASPAHPFAAEALFRIIQIREDDNRWMEAMDACTRLLTSSTGGVFFAQALTHRGVIQHRRFQFEDALRDFQRVIKEAPSSASAEQAYYMEGMCYYGLWQDEKALAVLKDFLGRYPASRWASEALFWLSNYAYNQGDYVAAEQGFIDYAGKYPQDPLADDALLRAGLAASKRKEFVRSVELFARLVKEYPASDRMAEARFAQGEAMSELAQYSAAIVIFDEIVGKYPESDLAAPAWSRKGDCQFTLGAEDPKRYAESVESYRIVAANPKTPVDLALQAEWKIGRSLEKMGRTRDAFDQYYVKVMLRYLEERSAGTFHGESAKVWFTRAANNAADIMEAEKDTRRAISILERVVESGVPAAGEAVDRIKRLKAEHRWMLPVP